MPFSLRLKSELKGINHSFTLQIKVLSLLFSFNTHLWSSHSVPGSLLIALGHNPITESTPRGFLGVQCPWEAPFLQYYWQSSCGNQETLEEIEESPPQEGLWDSCPVTAGFGKSLAFYKCLKFFVGVGKVWIQFFHRKQAAVSASVSSLITPCFPLDPLAALRSLWARSPVEHKVRQERDFVLSATTYPAPRTIPETQQAVHSVHMNGMRCIRDEDVIPLSLLVMSPLECPSIFL